MFSKEGLFKFTDRTTSRLNDDYLHLDELPQKFDRRVFPNNTIQIPKWRILQRISCRELTAASPDVNLALWAPQRLKLAPTGNYRAHWSGCTVPRPYVALRTTIILVVILKMPIGAIYPHELEKVTPARSVVTPPTDQATAEQETRGDVTALGFILSLLNNRGSWQYCPQIKPRPAPAWVYLVTAINRKTSCHESYLGTPCAPDLCRKYSGMNAHGIARSRQPVE